MNHKSYQIKYTQDTSWRLLSAEDQELLTHAKEAAILAYAPYSRFKVGAAVRLKKGVIITGCNQENASYSLCNCAERVALHKVFSEIPNAVPTDIAVYTEKKIQSEHPATPCGACRQVIFEYQRMTEHPIRLIISNPNEDFVLFENAADLLPLGFDGRFLL